MIQISSLSREYGDFKAVNQVSFEIKQGEVVGLLGHNGAGKTTIMKMITGYLEPTCGEIRVDDLLVGRDTRAIQARIGYLPENCPVWPEMSVIDYLEYQANLQGVEVRDIRARVAEAIRRTALREKATASIQTLSRGYRQRVGVAQAILHKPDIIILDEPTNGLDPTQIFQMRELIRDLAKSATVIISTHILQEVQAVCERVLIMRQGQLVVDSRMEDLQAGRQLRVTVNNVNAADYLRRVAGVSAVQQVETIDDLSSYLLDASGDTAPRVVTAVAEAGDQLYRLHPETRNLETVFAEVNRGEPVSV
ncbi:ABC transporter ATP-binding protein [Coraliomargarita sp. SDUM461004]|uniref:ABC transporter ATP-binding protein n=1 Tax=Thalassobacterium sedimentorum TaxID=3041258 RepID=A0ABU1AI36_9BACT|nr:ABC transporter ATP-binding protein [Coraliomargarita sp. SDUM461004]MDQ8194477.1 ABC transporter ATP-binding protein [Coraliomargarita sp. SDUM461004]